VQQAGGGAAGVDIPLDPDDGGDVVAPVGVGQPGGGIEDGDAAALIAVAPRVVAES